MTVLKVLYEGWAMECCGTPFVVGEEVVWNAGPDDAVGEGMWRVATHAGGPVGARTVLGRVRSIQVVADAFVMRASGYECVPEKRSLREVEACPKWFARLGEEDGVRRDETGVLVELETTGD
ncbi:DUF6578 domain-containing protein [Streptomyces sp. NBC_01465]|uniref:DUF6578 domain-containing protein n=1 Tax=Streptomyces sp. NBC_01465 TaxID=2903878 RepID=UPI002E3621DD|nr:DUF6578 domain-containing protein [Streptomyces sp. NBC_01465]